MLSRYTPSQTASPLQAMRARYGNESLVFLTHLSTIGEELSRQERFDKASALLGHALSFAERLAAQSKDTESLLASSRQHMLLAEHSLRMQQTHVAQEHAFCALQIALVAAKQQGSDLDPEQAWDNASLAGMRQPSPFASQLVKVPSRRYLGAFSARRVAAALAEAQLLVSRVNGAQGRVNAVSHVLNALVCADFAADGPNDPLVARARAQMCTCDAVGMRLQSPSPHSVVVQPNLLDECCFDSAYGVEPSNSRTQGAAQCPVAVLPKDIILQPSEAVPQLAAETARKHDRLEPHLKGSSPPPACWPARASAESVTSQSRNGSGNGAANTPAVAPLYISTDARLRACAAQLSKSCQILCRHVGAHREPLLRGMLAEARMASYMVRLPSI